MKTANIALFKNFLYGNGVNKIFCELYNDYRFPDNPSDVEEYLKQIDAHDVILCAFNFKKEMKNVFGQEYWTKLHEKWFNHLKRKTEEGYYVKAKARMEIIEQEADVPLYAFKDKNTPSFLKKTATTTSTPSMPTTSSIPQVEKKEIATPTIVKRPATTTGLKGINSFKFFDLAPKKNTRRMDVNEITISNKKGQYKITFNKEVTEKAREMGLTNYRAGQDDITGEVRIIFGNFEEDGHSFTYAKSSNLTICNKELVGILSEIFCLEEPLSTLYISKNLAPNTYLAYRITKERQ